MINLGPYSGKGCPEVRFRPMLLDRILEGAALLAFLAMSGSIYWLYTRQGGHLLSDVWVLAGASLLLTVVLGASSYISVRYINFPVRVSERNIGVQYMLSVRFIRVLNVIINLLLLSNVFMNYYKQAALCLYASLMLMAVSFVVYFILAIKYK